MALIKTYHAFRRSGETRLDFYIRHLHEKADSFERDANHPATSQKQKKELIEVAHLSRATAKEASLEMVSRHRQKIDQELNSPVVLGLKHGPTAQAQKPTGQSNGQLQATQSNMDVSAQVACSPISPTTPEESAGIKLYKEHLAFLCDAFTRFSKALPPKQLAFELRAFQSPGGVHRAINHVYFAAMKHGQDAMRELLIEYHAQGLPMPGAEIPEDLNLPFDPHNVEFAGYD